MDQNELSKDKGLTIDKDSQINVIVNTPDMEEDTIDLGRVFHNMKVKRRVYAWVLVLCLLLGVCAPLLLYQFKKPGLTVASVVTLDYEAPVINTTTVVDPVTKEKTTTKEIATDENGDVIYEQVQSLIAPDGNDLDLNQITSSYVLQQALKSMDLKEPVSIAALQRNISIERVLTDESRQAQDLASKMMTDKNSDAYEQLINIKLEYTPKITVRLTNGFSEEDSSSKIMLDDADLQLLLDRILIEYNKYLVSAYADKKLPNNDIAVVEQDANLEVLESLEMLQAALDNLYQYCEEKPDTVREYRSARNGRDLNDWMENIRTVKETMVDYLYANVYSHSIMHDRKALLSNYRFKLQSAQAELDALNETIAATQATLDSYKNDEVFVSMQDNDTYKSAQSTTEYYNKLVLQQPEYFKQQAQLETMIANLNNIIAHLESESETVSDKAIADAQAELQNAIAACKDVYNGVLNHMKELTTSTYYNTYINHTLPQGKPENFLTANAKKMAIGAAVGLVLACGLWFLAALAPEFRRNRKEGEDGNKPETGKEVAE